jgi:shikimate dehydrogenase/3-dehydroquinate dehydratase type I
VTKIAAVIAAGTAAEAERQARAAFRRGADLVEFRFDALRHATPADVRTLAAAFGPRSIGTLRTLGQGGSHGSDRATRHALLQEICRQPFRYADVELTSDAIHLGEYAKLARSRGKDLIVSHHFDRPSPAVEVADVLEACLAQGTVGKVAVPCQTVDQAVDLVDVARRQKKSRFVLIGMGSAGGITRILAEDLGQEIQYAGGHRATAPGQLDLDDAIRLRAKDGLILGLLGHPLGHSISPQIHEAALAALGLSGVYVPFDLEGDSIEPLLQDAERLRIRGLNVTIPYKETVAGLLDELDADAKATGAVNTVVLRNGWATGHNTDVYGFRMSLRLLGLRVGSRSVLVLGAGGAAKAIVHVLLREGASVQIANRTPDRARALAASFEDPIDIIAIEDLDRSGPWDLLVNATPVGTTGVESSVPIGDAVVRKARFVYDLVYNPRETPLLQSARRLGTKGTAGLDMLLHQAGKSFELWTGHNAPIADMRKAAEEALQ